MKRDGFINALISKTINAFFKEQESNQDNNKKPLTFFTRNGEPFSSLKPISAKDNSPQSTKDIKLMNNNAKQIAELLNNKNSNENPEEHARKLRLLLERKSNSRDTPYTRDYIERSAKEALTKASKSSSRFIR